MNNDYGFPSEICRIDFKINQVWVTHFSRHGWDNPNLKIKTYPNYRIFYLSKPFRSRIYKKKSF